MAILEKTWILRGFVNAVPISNTRHADGRCTTIPVHRGRDISPILVRQIAKDIELTIEEFYEER